MEGYYLFVFDYLSGNVYRFDFTQESDTDIEDYLSAYGFKTSEVYYMVTPHGDVTYAVNHNWNAKLNQSI